MAPAKGPPELPKQRDSSNWSSIHVLGFTSGLTPYIVDVPGFLYPHKQTPHESLSSKLPALAAGGRDCNSSYGC